MAEVLEHLSQRDRIKRIVIDRLEGRGEPSRGWTVKAMQEDYVRALSSYPEACLERAMNSVLSNRTRTTWPLAGDIKKACDDFMVTDPEPIKDDLVRRSVNGHQYVSNRLAANNGELQKRAIEGGYLLDLRRWLFDRACREIRNGNDPYISNADLDDKLRELEEIGRQRKASQDRFTKPTIRAPKGSEEKP